MHIEPVHAAPRQGDVRDSLADISKARRLLGYEPTALATYFPALHAATISPSDTLRVEG
jgi:nucleoside-diphosphate-sugar epimerase